MVQPTPSNDQYLQWRARLAAKQEARRLRYDPPAETKPTPPSTWDPSELFDRSPTTVATEPPPVPEPVPSDRQVIDLRPSAEQTMTEEPSVPGATEPPRRQALLDRYTRRARGLAPPSPSVADQIRQLNEQRVAGTISEHEFKVRKADLFNSAR